MNSDSINHLLSFKTFFINVTFEKKCTILNYPKLLSCSECLLGAAVVMFDEVKNANNLLREDKLAFFSKPNDLHVTKSKTKSIDRKED